MTFQFFYSFVKCSDVSTETQTQAHLHTWYNNASALTIEILRPDILTDGRTPIIPVTLLVLLQT